MNTAVKQESLGKILIVDDAQDIRDSLNQILSGAGYEVVQAEDGQNAFEAASSEEFDLIITDINMPGMNGIELLSSLRKLENRNRDTPAFVLTTESLRRFASTCEELGANVWIVKPVNGDKLIKYVGRFMRRDC